MNNFQRKGQRALQPLTYVDYPFTKRKKTFATLPPIEQLRLNQFHFYPEHPETTPHNHSIMFIAPQLVARFKAIASQLENLFKSLSPANCTLHAVPLQTHADLRQAIFYSSKLLKRPPEGVYSGLDVRPNVRYWGVKRTWHGLVSMSANDPKRTFKGPQTQGTNHRLRDRSL
jgi:hypothetical protein